MVVAGSISQDIGNTIEYLTPNGWTRSSQHLPVNMPFACAATINKFDQVLIIRGDSSQDTYYLDVVDNDLIQGPSTNIAHTQIFCSSMLDQYTRKKTVVVGGGVYSKKIELLDVDTGA